MGAALGSSARQVTLACGRLIDAQTLRTSASVKLDSMLSEADAIFLRSVLSHNSHLTPAATEAMLHKGITRFDRRHMKV